MNILSFTCVVMDTSINQQHKQVTDLEEVPKQKCDRKMDVINTGLKSGISIDDVYKIRVLDSDTATKTEQLRTQCSDFIESTTNFQQIVDGFLTMIESLAKSVEKEKMKAIGSSNLVSSMSKVREAEQIQLQILLMEKTIELERLRLQYQSLLKTKQEQQEYIDLLTSNK